MELTAEQRAIVEAGDADLDVTAGAGSGKTHVLVDRYLRLLEPCGVPGIAAITFTEAAATEMRERVRRAVMSDPALARHRADLDEAAIGTIHSLALRLLREHPVEAAIDPAAAVLAEDEAELLRRAACAEAVDAAAEAGDARTLALRGIGVYHAGIQLPPMLAQRDDAEAAFEALGPDPAGWPERVRALLDGAWGEQRAAVRAGAAAIADAVAPAADGADGAGGRIGEVAREVLAALHKAGAAPDWEAFAAALGEARERADLRVGSRTQSPDVEVRDAFRRLRDLDAEAGGLPAWNGHDGPALEALAGLRGLFRDAARRYEAAKRERRALDFLDLELGAVALLRDHPAVADALRARFRCLMVDEAQDINPAQAGLIRLLAGGEDADGGAPRPRLFLVGDGKQSIYRFRGADVRRFRELRALVAARGGETWTLSRSFRTHEALTGSLNALFGRVFAHPAEPFEAAMEPMTGRPAPPPGGGPWLTLLPIGLRSPEGGRTTDHLRRRVEADAVAAEIGALLGEGREVRDPRAGAGGAMRPARPGDVAVLLRRFTNVHAFEQALEARGVPCATPGGAGFFTRQEVLDCGGLLRWLAEPQDAIALAGVLRSPFFALRDDTLLALRRRRRPLHAALGDPPADIAEGERARCAHAAGVLAGLRAAAGAAPAGELLELALERTGAEAAWAPLEGGEQARANIRKLVRVVRTLAGRSLAEVAAYLEQRRDELDVREAPAVLDRPDAVQLMTVHAAKGLEFPIVFVPEAHAGPRDGWPVVRWRRGDGVSATLQRGEDAGRRPRPGFYAHLQRLDEREDAAEHRRLFYVAATRAADRLCVSGDEAGGGEGGWLAAALAACADGAVRGAEVREPVLPDPPRSPRAPTRPPLRPGGAAGGGGGDEDYVAPLLARPRVIPVRASTPVTALRPPADAPPPRARRGDRHGALLGSVVHRAIERSGGAAPGPAALEALVRELAGRPLDAEAVRALAAEAEELIARFARTPIAASLADPSVGRWFELPFAWDWDGLPVHGAIDLVCRDGGGWRVIDFKTDRTGAAGAAGLARRYLVQIGLYRRAVEAAVGAPPAAGLLFLRSGELVEPPPADLDAALAEARARVDAGALLDPEALEHAAEPE